MKTLLLMRHAKSSHDDEGLSDHERPLNDRGRCDAPRLVERLQEAERLTDADLLPDRLLCSTARRAKETAAFFAAIEGVERPISYDHRLYHATPEGVLDVVAGSGGTAERLMIVGHNPGLEQLVRHLTGEDRHMATAAIARIELPIEAWPEVAAPLTGRLVDFWKPRG
ncbi:MAG: histidine phosphatase family protein [Planctomycetaceae bacterium]